MATPLLRRRRRGARRVLVGRPGAQHGVRRLDPQSVLFEAATPIVFVGFLVPAVVDRPRAVAVLAAALTTVAGSRLPSGTGLLAGIAAGVAAGALTLRRPS